MVKKEDFSKLEDVCTLIINHAIAGFHMRLRDSLKSVPSNVIENLNLDPEVKTKLQFNGRKENKDSTTKLAKTKDEKSEEITKNYEDFTTKLAEENLEEVRNILLKVHISGLIMDFLIDGQISSFCPGQHETALLTLYNITQTHSIFVKL